MTAARLEAVAAGRLRVTGVLDATTVTQLLRDSQRLFAGQADLEIDLAGVQESDSSGLALLLEWLRLARGAGQQVRFANLPEQLLALARISEVEPLFAADAAQGTATA